MMSDNTHFPSLPPSDDAAAVVSIQSVIDYFIAHYCGAMKREIRRNGLEEAMKLWEKEIGIHHTEDWWPPVARAVEALIDEAYEARARKEEEERLRARKEEEERQRMQTPLFNFYNTSTSQCTKTDNDFKPGSNSQVFNGDANGEFGKK
jgi:hypothetical protein